MSSLRNRIVVIALGLASCAGTAQAALQAVDPGPYTAATGFFPLFYRDTNNLSLDLCLSKAITVNGPLCLLGANPGIFDPSQPTVFPVNFPDEAFYFTADANVVGQGIDLGYVAHLEAAFAVGAPTAGQQITFARIRVRADFAVTVPTPGFYRITHPYGIEEFSVAAPGQRVINATRDIGIGLPGDFSGALAGDIGPFLRRAAAPGGAPLPFIQGLDPATLQPTGELFIGDPNVPQFATGSPFGAARNLVRIQRIASLGGAPIGGIDVSSNQFFLSGRVWNGQRPTAVTVERATYSRTLNPDLSARTRIEAFADSAPGASVCFRETLSLLAGTEPCQTAMQGDGAGKFFGQDPDAQVLPPYIVVTAVNTTTPPTSIAQPLVDLVKVLQAQFDRQTRTLVVRATSSDQTVRPTITALGLGNLSPVTGTLAEQRLQLVLAAEPPAFVTLVSSAGGRQTEPVTVAAIQNNRPPVANPDTATTPEDTPVNIAVLANDTDPDGDALTVTAVSGVTNGTATINANGTVSFTPALNFNGIGRFTYSIADGRGGSAGASVAVTVNGVNDRPVAVNDTATTPLNTALNIAVLANDIDVDGNALTVTTVTQPANGTVVINNPGTPGNTVRFTPAANFFGATSFSYAVSDGNGGTAAASVSVTVTSPPVDLDIATFRVPNAVRVGRALGAVTVTVRNNGTFNAPRTATLTATQNGVQVLTRSLQVSDPVGGGTTQFVIPTFTPAAAGTISWRFEIFDDNPDVDVATGTTNVNP